MAMRRGYDNEDKMQKQMAKITATTKWTHRRRSNEEAENANVTQEDWNEEKSNEGDRTQLGLHSEGTVRGSCKRGSQYIEYPPHIELQTRTGEQDEGLGATASRRRKAGEATMRATQDKRKYVQCTTLPRGYRAYTLCPSSTNQRSGQDAANATACACHRRPANGTPATCVGKAATTERTRKAYRCNGFGAAGPFP